MDLGLMHFRNSNLVATAMTMCLCNIGIKKVSVYNSNSEGCILNETDIECILDLPDYSDVFQK
jgi:hypothetical protein